LGASCTRPKAGERFVLQALLGCLAIGFALLLAGCSSRKSTHAKLPPPPEKESAGQITAPDRETGHELPKAVKPIYEETGIASWYGSPFHNRRGANGEIYDMHALTAAHRTLPLNSVARVTNLQTGHSATVRITDRGPFIEGRMLDLSLEAAKQVDVWRAGLAKVKLEVFEAPNPIDRGGRWCVQVGAFSSKAEASKFRSRLQRRYHSADVLQFTGPTGEWVRIRVLNDDRARAEAVLKENPAPQGAAFLVRLD
jgi:rare lipoprotein A